MKVFVYFCTVAAIVEAEIEMIQVLFRHGDRAPSFSYPFDIHDESAWPRGYSQLTEQGYEQAMELGEYIRETYAFSLPRKINRKTVRVRSSDKDRCIETAMGVTKSLFPHDRVPIHTYSSFKEDLLLKPNSVACSAADLLVQNDKKKLYESRNREYSEFFHFLSEKTGMTVNMATISNLYNSVYREYVNGLEQPSWLFQLYDSNSTVFDVILELKRQDRMETFNSFMKSKLRTGYLAGQLVQEITERASGLSDRQISLYSTHDATITSLMYTLGISNDLLPPYAAALIFELHSIAGQKYVKVLYRNSTIHEPSEMQLPGCAMSLCPLATFEETLEIVSIENRKEFEELCSYKHKPMAPNKPLLRSLRNFFSQVIACIFILLKVGFVVHLYFSSLSKEYQ